MFDSLPEGFYAVDLMNIGFISDIPLSSETTADRIVEETPKGLPPRDFSTMRSAPLSANDLIGIDAENVVGLLCGLMRARKERKTLYLVYEPDDLKDIEEIILYALKLLPSGIANTISFITCFGESRSAGNYDICGIPTTEKEIIQGLSDGIVFRPMSDTPDLTVSNFGMLKEMMDNGHAGTWIELVQNCAGIISTIEDLEAIVPLVAEFHSRTAMEPDAALSVANSKIAAFSERYGLLVRLFDDPFTKLKVRDSVRGAILASGSVQREQYEKKIITPLRVSVLLI